MSEKNVGQKEDFIPNTDLPAGICFGWENFGRHEAVAMGRHEAVAMGRHEAVAMGRHEAVAMGRQTDLVLDASLPKHKKRFENRVFGCRDIQEKSQSVSFRAGHPVRFFNF